jgi:signal transduction histidine kinase
LPSLIRRSLLAQLGSLYLVFVLVVLSAGLGVSAVVEQRLRAEVQASDQAMAQEIAVDTSLKLTDAETALQQLGTQVVTAGTSDAIGQTFQAFLAADRSIDHVYWLSPYGSVLVSVSAPATGLASTGVGAEFSPPGVVDTALETNRPAFEVGIAEETALNAGVIIAEAVRNGSSGAIVGILVDNLSLDELSAPLVIVAAGQLRLNRHLQISVIGTQGELIASQDHASILQADVNKLPGAAQALEGDVTSVEGAGPDGTQWLYSSVPVPGTGWAVVVQRPDVEAFEVIARFHLWLIALACMFAVGGLVFWLALIRRVIRPLLDLSAQHQKLLRRGKTSTAPLTALTAREDEIGHLARSLERLERNVRTRLGEMHTLLETSNAVVNSLDPREVGETIIREARRLVDIQAATVLVPDATGVLRVLVSAGRTPEHNAAMHVDPEDLSLPAARALHDGRPVQLIADGQTPFPPLSFAGGFRAVLSIPIVSPHVGSVVLVVYRTEPVPFIQNEIDLLLTFANYATLAWEHAVLYERSDERLRAVAAENERLYRITHEEKQRLAAIVGSMSDGLVLSGADGRVLYANPGAYALLDMPAESVSSGTIAAIHAALQAQAEDPSAYVRARVAAESGVQSAWSIELRTGASRQVLALRLFDVRDETSAVIGRGLLMRDITGEREADEFKTTLLAAVGHELRTPLAAIKGYASSLLQDDVAWSVDAQRHSLRTISREVEHLSSLVRDLLDLSRQQAGVLPLHRDVWHVRDLIESARQQVDRPGSVQIAELGDVPLVYVDRIRIEVVVRNLLANALAYGGDSVQVACAARDAWVEIAVTDNGPGLEPDELAHLFERFYRTRAGQQRRSHGTGLGLAICKAFVDAHGGTIAGQSGPAGTTIRFTLPQAPAAAATAAMVAPAEDAVIG